MALAMERGRSGMAAFAVAFRLDREAADVLNAHHAGCFRMASPRGGRIRIPDRISRLMDWKTMLMH
jgi:hypothetical protein